jgi:hypothetical protein
LEVRGSDFAALLYIFDVAGEDLASGASADLFAPFLSWSKAVIFVTSPEIVYDLTAASDAKVLSDLIERMRGFGNYGARLMVVLSKADRLTSRGWEIDDLSRFPGAEFEGDTVREMLIEAGSETLVNIADSWDNVSYHLAAPFPEMKDEPGPSYATTEPFGVIELLRALIDGIRRSQ